MSDRITQDLHANRGRSTLLNFVAMTMLLSLGGVLGLSWVGVVAAQPAQPVSQYWQEIAHPGRARAHTLLRQARTQLESWRSLHSDSSGHSQRLSLLQAAIRRLSLARDLAPDDPDILFTLAQALARLPHEDRASAEQATDHYQALHDLDPVFAPDIVSFELGLLHTRLGNYGSARRAYEQTLSTTLLPSENLALLARLNLAEVTMMDGALAAAQAEYEHAIHAATRPEQLDIAVLARWGLAVTLDRMGESLRALEAARSALATAGGTADILRSDDVFFVPAFEIHYYLALSQEAAAWEVSGETEPPWLEERTRGPLLSTPARRHLGEAVLSWRRFLSQGGRQSRWADSAQTHIDRLTAALRRLRSPS